MEKTEPLPADTLAPGQWEHPDYVIKRELGRGGMGIVYLAHNTLLGRDEALKVIWLQIRVRRGTLERFLREIRSVARLRHPNIVTAYHATRLAECIVFSMEYVEGLDLARLVKANGPLPIGHACNFVYQAALGLQHAHEQGLVHRDVKPGNLMLTCNGDKARVKVLDFGLAKATRDEKFEEAITSASETLGTPDFMAPEQVLDAPSVDIRADIYSLGATLYHLLTGHPPFRANSLYELYQAHISRDVEPLNVVRPDVPAELAAVVVRMMAKEPRERFQSPGEVARALRAFFKPTEACLKAEGTDLLSRASPARFRDEPLENRQRPWAVPGPRQPFETPRARPGRALWAACGMLLLGIAVGVASLLLKVRTPQVSGSPLEATTAIGDSEGWVPVFNGRDKTGWIEGRGHHGQWNVVNGVLQGQGGDTMGQPAVLLTTRSDYSNFRLKATILNEGHGKRIKVRMTANADAIHATDGYGVRVEWRFPSA